MGNVLFPSAVGVHIFLLSTKRQLIGHTHMRSKSQRNATLMKVLYLF